MYTIHQVDNANIEFCCTRTKTKAYLTFTFHLRTAVLDCSGMAIRAKEYSDDNPYIVSADAVVHNKLAMVYVGHVCLSLI